MMADEPKCKVDLSFLELFILCLFIQGCVSCEALRSIDRKLSNLPVAEKIKE